MATATTPSRSRARLLIVDDHEENLLALEAVLADPRYELVRANSGRAALRAALRYDFAVILLDVAMPDMDGYETATMLRERERSRETPIIFLTANYRSDTHVFRGYAVGGVDYLFKPFSPEVLKSKVAVFVELFESREALKRQTQALQRAHDELELRVQERTAELAKATSAERRLRAQAEQVSRLKDEFLATLSHELRTPLNAILGWTHLLGLPTEDPSMTERAVSVIKNNAVAQSQIIEDILDVSRIIGGKLRLRLSSTSLAEIVTSALDAIVPAAAAKEIELVRDVDVPDHIVIDRDRIQQVCWNLLSNAVKFTPKGGRITVTLTREGGDAKLVVADTGVGIPPDFLPHIFDRFSQADSSTTRRHGGLGLGMAIVRHFVELHGGTVQAQSAGPDQGSTFTVVLPWRSVKPGEAFDETASEVPVVPPVALPQSLPNLGGRHVLVVDDDPDLREYLRRQLEQAGATVSTAPDVDVGLRLLRDQDVTVLVSDIEMPGTGGLDLIKSVRQQKANAHLPAIAVSAHVRPDDAKAAIEAGFDLHLAKPVDMAQLVTAIDALSAIRGQAEFETLPGVSDFRFAAPDKRGH
jgi:signal transduction histidine kinase